MINTSFFIEKPSNQKTIYIDDQTCHDTSLQEVCLNKQNKNLPMITVKKINLTKYRVHIQNAQGSFLLVFSDEFNEAWKPNLDNKSLSSKHILVNGYANAWYINPKETNYKKNYDLVVEMRRQKYFYASLVISSMFFVFHIIWGFLLFFRKNITAIINKVYGKNKR